MLLEARQLAIAYGDAVAVWDATLDVGDGEVVAVIGPNGAGKSTLINAVAGLLRWRAGELRLDGLDLATVPSHLICGHGIALVPEGRRLFTRMSVEENLEIGSYRGLARRTRRQTLERVYEMFPILRERRQQLAGSLSGGQQQMLALGMALMTEPRILLLDEPMSGLAPVIVEQVLKSLVRINTSTGTAIVLVEQNVKAALPAMQRAVILKSGRLVWDGAAAELARHENLWAWF
jgi:branched-chain amino acid transport system ATP-binding protein